MGEIFETVLILSIIGFFITIILLCLKPITIKKFPAKWQYYIWIVVVLTMTVPVYKFIPKSEVQKIRHITKSEIQTKTSDDNMTDYPKKHSPVSPPATNKNNGITRKTRVNIFKLLTFIWLCGSIIFFLVVITNYFIYIVQKRKNSVLMENNSAFNEVKNNLGIRRKIKIRVSPSVGSPMLVGVFFPTVYIPCREIQKDMMKMIFLHELTHYKRYDLVTKWFALFVNAVHWFNPTAYLINKNLSEACETSCDVLVTEEMDEEEQKLYMKTILEMVEK